MTVPAGISGEPDTVVTGELGRSLNIRCLAYGYPIPTVYWYRGITGPMVPFSSSLYEARDNVLQIKILNAETLGEYTCQAYNGLGRAATWSLAVEAYNPYQPPDVVPITPRAPETEATTPELPDFEQQVYTGKIRHSVFIAFACRSFLIHCMTVLMHDVCCLVNFFVIGVIRYISKHF